MSTVEPTTEAISTVHYPRPVYGAHTVAVAFSAWGHQPSRVTAACDGGRDNKAHIAVRVGDCLTYVYDRDALASHVTAWREAAQHNGSLRLPTATTTGKQVRAQGNVGQDMALVCNVSGRQWHAVLSDQTTAGGVVIAVAVGAVTVRVHTSEALRCYLLAWTQASSLGAVFDDHGDVMKAAPGW